MNLLKRFAPLWVVLLALLAYANSVPGAFHLDDFHVVERNVYIRSLDNVPQFFVDASTFTDLPANRDYRPLVSTGFAVIYRLVGLSPWLFSLWSVVLHALTTLVVFYLARGMESWVASEEIESPTWDAATGVGLIAASIFAVHPFLSESVNYVNGQAVLLVTLFYLTAMLCYARVVSVVAEGASRFRVTGLIGLALVAQVAALCSKPTAITLPVMLIAYDLLFAAPLTDRRAAWLARVRRWSPFIVVNLVYLWWRGVVLSAPYGGAVARGYLENTLTQTRALAFFYLKGFIWPTHLSVDPDFELTRAFSEPEFLAALGVVLALTLAVLLVVHRFKLVAFAALWFIVTLLPVSFMKPLHQIVNEHRVYLPMLGLVLPFALGVVGVVVRCGPGGRERVAGRVAGGLVIVLLIALTATTMARNRVWQTPLALWGDAAAQSDEWRPHMNYALALERAERGDEALEEFIAAVAAGDLARPRINLGLAYIRRDMHEAGIVELERGVALWPGLAEGRYYLGYGYEVVGRHDDAAREYRLATKLNPTYMGAHRRWAALEELRGQPSQARRIYEHILELLPGDADAIARLEDLENATDPGTVIDPPPPTAPDSLRQQPAPSGAIAPTASSPTPSPTSSVEPAEPDGAMRGGGFQLIVGGRAAGSTGSDSSPTPSPTSSQPRSESQSPPPPPSTGSTIANEPVQTIPTIQLPVVTDSVAVRIDELFNRAFAHQSAGRRAEAIAAYGEVLELDPDHLVATYNLCDVLTTDPQDGDVEQALVVLERLHQQWPDHVGVLYRLGEVEMSMGRLDDAGRHLREFLQRADGPEELIDRARRILQALPESQ